MRHLPGARREHAHLVTEAPRPLSQDIAYRERRYLIMMGIRIGCFVLAIVLFVNGAGWYSLIPAVGAVVIPYFAVVFANGGREPTKDRGLADFQPTLPASRLEALDAARRPPLIVGYVTCNEHDQGSPPGGPHGEQSRERAQERVQPDGQSHAAPRTGRDAHGEN